jgi:dihydroorotate dehydrogenase electron transfer subunit
MGVAPLVFLAASLRALKGRSNLKNGIASAPPRNDSLVSVPVLVLIGAKTKAQVLCAKEFKQLGCEVKIATDDGSAGFKGKVTDLLSEVLLKNLRTQELKNSIYACGPQPMLKAIAEIARENKSDSQLSLEEHMACGIGACLGCVVSTRSGYKRVCKDGPVFSGEELIW